MSESAVSPHIELYAPPVILGAAGDIGRTALQQFIDRGVTPAGVVLTEHRLANQESRDATAAQIASNYAPEGEATVLESVELDQDALTVNGEEIPVFTPDSQHEIFQEGHGVVDATGQHKKRELLEGFLEQGVSFVNVTSPINEKENIPTAVYGAGAFEENIARALHERILSDSSCTTTAGTAFLSPLLAENSKFGAASGALLNITHARTKSNDPNEINNNIKLSSSGALKEIPKVLGIGEEDPFVFDLKCTRTNVACGSLADITLLLKEPHIGRNAHNLRTYLVSSLHEGGTSYEIDDELKDTKGVVGRLASVVLNLSEIRTQEIPGGGLAVFGIHGFYDNVHGYTRSVLDNYGHFSTLDAKAQQNGKQAGLAGSSKQELIAASPTE